MNKCNAVMEEYLNLDKGERIPLGITLHLLACKNCRNQVRLLRSAERSSVPDSCKQTALDDQAILAVMKKISANKNDSKKNPISLSKWIIGGAAMVALFIAFSVLEKPGQDRALTVYTYIELAALITAYCALFIRSNMDFFVKKIKKLPDLAPGNGKAVSPKGSED